MINNICRAKRIDNNEWIEGYHVFDEQNLIVKDLKCVVRGVTKFLNVHPVSCETIGRAVNKNDKNGMPIFEGDIIEYCGCVKYIVRYGQFNKEVGLGYYYGVGFYLERIGDSEHQVPFNGEICYEYEVIGNIHDNEELLVCG